VGGGIVSRILDFGIKWRRVVSPGLFTPPEKSPWRSLVWGAGWALRGRIRVRYLSIDGRVVLKWSVDEHFVIVLD
jgi:hypothetical protein